MIVKKRKDLVGKESAEYLKQKIKNIDEHISVAKIKIPEASENKIKDKIQLQFKENLILKRFNRWKLVLQAVVVVIVICNIYPKAVPALKNTIYQFFSVDTKQNMDIYILNQDKENFQSIIPEGFQVEDLRWNSSIKRFCGINNEGKYIHISVYDEDYFLSHDSEDLEEYETIRINNTDGIQMSKNGIITIIFPCKKQYIEIESDLPEKTVQEIAEKMDLE